jgi:hypothetical protein
MNQNEIKTTLFLLHALNWAAQKGMSDLDTGYELTDQSIQEIKGFNPTNDTLFAMLQEEFPNCTLSRDRFIEIVDAFRKSRGITYTMLVDFVIQQGGQATTGEIADATGLTVDEVFERMEAIQRDSGKVR